MSRFFSSKNLLGTICCFNQIWRSLQGRCRSFWYCRSFLQHIPTLVALAFADTGCRHRELPSEHYHLISEHVQRYVLSPFIRSAHVDIR